MFIFSAYAIVLLVLITYIGLLTYIDTYSQSDLDGTQ
jgi:hypothetical protein